METNNLKQKKPARYRLMIFRRLFAGICMTFFIVHSVYGWSSTETTGYFTTHQFLNMKAYDLLAEHPMLKKGYVKFPSISDIGKNSGVKPEIRGGALSIGGQGPDNPENSDFAAHYFNPSLGNSGLGGAPKKVSETYAGLKRSLIVMSDRYKDYFKESNNPINPAYYAAYLAHFIQDMTCPFHVIGAPSGYFNYDPKAMGPYAKRYGAGIWEFTESSPFRNQNAPNGSVSATPSTGGPAAADSVYVQIDSQKFWNLMVDRFKKEKSPGANWFEPNYYNGPGFQWTWTYRGTHFLYEAAVGPYHNSYLDVSMEPNEAKKFRKLWYASNTDRPGSFAINMAIETKGRLDREEKEFMFNPAKMKTIGEVPIPREAWSRAVQATYTVWRASFSALFVDRYTDVKLVKVSNNPDKYKVRLKIKNVEPEENATNVQAKVIFKAGKNQYDFGKASIDKIEKGKDGKDGESDWLDCDKEAEVKDIAEGMLYITVTGNYNTVPDAEETFFEYPAFEEPLAGVWRLKGTKRVTEIEIKYNPRIRKHEALVVQQGDFRWHTKGTIVLSFIEPQEAPVKESAPAKFEPGKLYKGTEYSWEEIKVAGSNEVRKGNETRIKVLLILDGENLEYQYKLDKQARSFTRSDEPKPLFWYKVK